MTLSDDKLRQSHTALIKALAMFLEDARFNVQVGGNPIAVGRMILDAKAALAAARKIQNDLGRNPGGK